MVRLSLKRRCTSKGNPISPDSNTKGRTVRHVTKISYPDGDNEAQSSIQVDYPPQEAVGAPHGANGLPTDAHRAANGKSRMALLGVGIASYISAASAISAMLSAGFREFPP